jgi:hypothetical protein
MAVKPLGREIRDGLENDYNREVYNGGLDGVSRVDPQEGELTLSSKATQLPTRVRQGN